LRNFQTIELRRRLLQSMTKRQKKIAHYQHKRSV
jgi:hypothetical protein